MTFRDRLTPLRRNAEQRGRRSEGFAALFLVLKGYRILGKRVRTGAGEIDLVARSPSGIICFIEVKARRTGDDALASVLPRQQGRIVRAANLFLAVRPALARAPVRFDIVTVAPGRLPRHVRDAWRAGDVSR